MQSPNAGPHALPEGAIALVPMRNVVLFLHLLMPVTVSRAKSIAVPQPGQATVAARPVRGGAFEWL